MSDRNIQLYTNPASLEHVLVLFHVLADTGELGHSVVVQVPGLAGQGLPG